MKNGENIVVLVIDDDSVVRDSIADYLSNQAANSDEGIDAFHSSCPNLVVCDINMPDKKGFDTLTYIFSQSPTQPIIILSDVGNTEISEAEKLSGRRPDEDQGKAD